MPQRLEEYYAKIEAMMAEGEAKVAERDPATAEHLRKRIADSGLLIASYQLFVHREVFVPLIEHGDARTRARVSELKVECIALTEDLRVNIRDFATAAPTVPLDWDVVAAKMAWFNGRLRSHIANVRTLMAPDLSDAEHARLRARRVAAVGVHAA